MYKSYWMPLPYKYKTVPYVMGDGINNGLPIFDIKDTELTDCLNIDSREYPAINVRAGRSIYTSITTPRMLGQRNNQYLMAVDDTVWKYYDGNLWNDLQTGLTAADAEVEDFATGATRFTIFSNGTDRYYWDGSTVTALTDMPATRLFTVHRGRVYAAKDNDIAFSALNIPSDWTTPDDAGSIDVTNSKGPLKAITTYGDHVIAFSEYSMHELYGTGPLNYSLVDVSREIGCVSDRSIKEVNGRLYWLGVGYIYTYGGGVMPKPISDPKVQGYIERINWDYAYKAAAGTDGRRYYLAVPIDSLTDNNIMLVYDTTLGNWYIEDGSFIDFVEMNGILYGVDVSGNIWNMIDGTDDNGTAVSWYAISKPYLENNLGDKKEWHCLYALVDLPTGSTLDCYLSNDAEGSSFTLVKSFTASSNIQNQRLDIPLTVGQNADFVRIKFSGTGPCTIHKLEKQLRIRRETYA